MAEQKQETALVVRTSAGDALEAARAFAARVVGFVVANPKDHADATEFHQELHTVEKQWDESRKEEKQPHLDAGRLVDEAWAEQLEIIRKAKGDLGRKIVAFEEEVRRARIKAEQEQERLRLEAERKERERLEKEAAKAAKKGDEVAAAEIRDQAAVVYVPPSAVADKVTSAPAPALTRTKGSRRPETFTAEVRPEQQQLLARAIGLWNSQQEDPDKLIMPAAYWQPNQTALDKFAQATKAASPIDGVKFHRDVSLASRRKR